MDPGGAQPFCPLSLREGAIDLYLIADGAGGLAGAVKQWEYSAEEVFLDE